MCETFYVKYKYCINGVGIMTFAETIKKHRKNRKLSINSAAKLIGIGASHLHYLESGATKKPKMETLYKIMVFYGLPVDETCREVQRIPMDVYYKIINNPDLVGIIRNLEV